MILQFAREWDDRCPLVIVPTKFINADGGLPPAPYQSGNLGQPPDPLLDRPCKILPNRSMPLSPGGCRGQVATVQEIFRLQGARMNCWSRGVIPAIGQESSAIILAASRGGPG
jgi:phosphoenolpyruvate phosphomutase